jgi:hypothetical protein
MLESMSYRPPQTGARVLAFLPFRQPEPATVCGHIRRGDSLLVRLDFQPDVLRAVTEWRMLLDEEIVK